MDWFAVLDTVMPYLLTFVFALLADKYLVTYEKKETVVRVTEFAEDAVLFVEDLSKNSPTPIKGIEKAKMAIAWVKAAMKASGYPVPDHELVQGTVAAIYQRSDLNHS